MTSVVEGAAGTAQGEVAWVGVEEEVSADVA